MFGTQFLKNTQKSSKLVKIIEEQWLFLIKMNRQSNFVRPEEKNLPHKRYEIVGEFAKRKIIKNPVIMAFNYI